MRPKKHITLTPAQQVKADKIYRNYHKIVLKSTKGILNNHHLAEDAAEDTFIHAFENIDKIDENNDSRTKHYLTVISRNVCMDVLRNRKKIQLHESPIDDERLDYDYADSEDNGPLEIVLNNEMLNYIKVEIKNLDLIYQDVFTLRTAYGHSSEEAAKILHISTDAADKRYYRARKMLLARLEVYRNEQQWHA